MMGRVRRVKSHVWGLVVQVIMGKAGDKVQGVAMADMYDLQDQIRASFENIRDLKQRLDQSDKHSAWCFCQLSPLTNLIVL